MTAGGGEQKLITTYPMVERKSPITEQRYEASFLEGSLLSLIVSLSHVKQGGKEFVILSVTCVGLNGF